MAGQYTSFSGHCTGCQGEQVTYIGLMGLDARTFVSVLGEEKVSFYLN